MFEWRLKHRHKRWHFKNRTIGVYTATIPLIRTILPKWTFQKCPAYEGKRAAMQFSFCWFGIGILYERDEESFSNEEIDVMIKEMNPEYPYFRNTNV